MTRLMCISDIHLSDDFGGYTGSEWLREFFERIVEDADIHHLIIAGDIVGTYHDPDESGDFAALRRLLRGAGMYSWRGCTYVPGNHDTRSCGFSLLSTGEAERSVQRRMPTLFRVHRSAKCTAFPILKTIGDAAVIGIDTASDWSGLTFHSGCVGETQLDALQRLLARPQVHERHVILVMHHPPVAYDSQFVGGLWDAAAFWEVVGPETVDLIICGHEHQSSEEEIGGVPVICVGGFMADDGHSLIIDLGCGRLNWWWWDAWA